MRPLSWASEIPRRPAERCRIYSPRPGQEIKGIALSDALELLQLHWVSQGGPGQGRHLPHYDVDCPHCPKRIVVKGFVYAQMTQERCNGLMEFTPEAGRDLLRILAERGEELRGMQVFTTRPKGGRNGRVMCRVGQRLFDVESVKEEHFARDVKAILESKLCDMNDLFTPPGIQMPEV